MRIGLTYEIIFSRDKCDSRENRDKRDSRDKRENRENRENREVYDTVNKKWKLIRLNFDFCILHFAFFKFDFKLTFFSVTPFFNPV